MEQIIIENKSFRLVVGADCIAKSLVCKATGEECLAPGVKLPLFASTQERPFNNEVKLAYPCKRTTYPASSLRREGDRLVVGFDVAPYYAFVKITEQDDYIAFSLEDFRENETGYGTLKLDRPPVAEFCLLQLAVADRKNFGEWLNVMWDADTAINVLATAPQTLIDSQEQDGYHIMHAHVRKDVRLKGPGVALITCGKDALMDAIAKVEEDYNLPRGVENRRHPLNNASVYFADNVNPKTVDQHIAYCKAGGFRMMQIYYTSMFFEGDHWSYAGNYDYNEDYPNGREDLVAVLNKVKAAGITPGLHFLAPHIGMKSRYVTPVADHRLHLKQHYTLAKPLGLEDTTIYVEQDTSDAVVREEVRVLQFGGELIRYEGFTTEYPYCFTGCTRGAYETNIVEHPLGQIGGILDVSEFGAFSCYLDQNTSLADEVAQKLADAYNCGFCFVYFDGAEGTKAPFGYHIPNGQYRVWKKMQPQPMLAEGAAKAHFSWHMLSGGNAFDIFKPAIFKQKIGEYPAQEIKRMKNDFTRVNFGWWAFFGTETQADHYEYATSRAAAWDCPATIQSDLKKFAESPRTADILEVMRRWEEVRATKWLTDDQKEQLKNLEQEHILLINEQKEFELVPYDRIENAAGGDPEITAYSFVRNGENHVVYWHHSADGALKLSEDVQVMDELWEQPKCCAELPLGKRRYVKSSLPMEKLITAFQNAEKKG